jgi:hypothetical protein
MLCGIFAPLQEILFIFISLLPGVCLPYPLALGLLPVRDEQSALGRAQSWDIYLHRLLRLSPRARHPPFRRAMPSPDSYALTANFQVRSLSLDRWSLRYLIQVQLGGNEAAARALTADLPANGFALVRLLLSLHILLAGEAQPRGEAVLQLGRGGGVPCRACTQD